MGKSEKKIKIIPARRNFYNDDLLNGAKKRRVCAYARVSTNKEEQVNSFEAQLDYYKKFVANHNEWIFCGFYSDEGISGTSTRKRDGFNAMFEDAIDGKLDLIITKSLSRFARNTVDSLKAIRKLKNYGVEVYFEKENVYTLSQDGEILLTLMSSFAQEESRSISENVKWARKRMMEKGKYSVPYKSFLGYDKGSNGLVINDEQAKVVRRIFKLYLDGYNIREIKDILNNEKISTPMGVASWNKVTILSILRNEKYKGDALLQKYYFRDFISKEVVKNNGEVQQYYIENSHEPIIDKDTFDLVQNELKIRNEKTVNKSHHPLTYKIYCGDCGSVCTRRQWKSRDGRYKFVYSCKYKQKNKCDINSMSEDEIICKFIKAMNYVILNKNEIIDRDNKIINEMPTDEELIELRDKLYEDIKTILNSANVTNANEIIKVKQTELSNVEHNIHNNRLERIKLQEFIKNLSKIKKAIKCFDSVKLNTIIDKMLLLRGGMTVIFKDGFELNV